MSVIPYAHTSVAKEKVVEVSDSGGICLVECQNNQKDQSILLLTMSNQSMNSGNDSNVKIVNQ